MSTDDDYLFDPSARPDAEVQRLERALAPMKYRPRAFAPAPARASKSAYFAAFSVAAAFAALLVGATWHALTDGGAPIAEASVHVRGDLVASTLKTGTWLETDADEAHVHMEGLGVIDLSPKTRVRFVESKERRELELAVGTLHAKVVAPPRFFVVDTPTAAAVDLGCEYTLSVDDRGTMLHVSWGFVSLEGKSTNVTVPAGASCRTRPNVGPGLPSWDDASASFHRAVDRLEASPTDDEALTTLLHEARPRDTLTLSALLPRLDGSRRHAVFSRLSELAPPPVDVHEGDPKSYGAWQSALEATW